ncbi:MAG: anaerobic sulfatase maturase [Lachnospiraceae bacterium]|nr:anaerobic sulfatase maturase [Lachnospiraceae bacterium]
MKQQFVVMAKPVGSRCNMRCDYCYYLDKGQFSEHERQTRMSYEILENLIRGTIEASPGPVVSFVWHGGEPTLAGLDFYKKVIELERKYLPSGWSAWNNLQTNGYALNDLWCRFLKENRFDVGISFDGAESIHDANRHDLKGAGTYARVVRSIQRLCSFGIEPDILCTVNSASCRDPLAVYSAIKKTGCTWCQFIPIVVRIEDGFSDESITPEGYGQFLIAVFDEWVHNDLGSIDVQLFAEMARIMAGGQASLCWMSETCGHALIAEEDGAIYSCDHFVDDEHRLGRLPADVLSEMLNSDFQTAFGNSKKDTLTPECRNCRFLRFCGGGCLKDRFDGHYYLCEGLRMLFAHAEPILSKVIEMSRAGMTPSMIMKNLPD